MESTLNKAFMLAIDIFIFIIAVSVSIFLMMSLLDYSDKALDYTNKIIGTSLSVDRNGIYKKYNVFKGNEIISMINNYGYNGIKSNKYTNEFNYGVKISLYNKDNGHIQIKGENSKINFKELCDEIRINSYYYILIDEYISYDNQSILIKELEFSDVDDSID